MKIGFVLDDSLDKTDGVQQYVTTLGLWFTREGHEVHYLVGETRRKDLMHVHSLSRNFQTHFNQNRMSTPLPANKKKIRELLEKEDFDVLHVQMPYSPFMAGRVIKAAKPRTAIVGTFHILPYSFMESIATRLLAAYLRPTRKKFDRVVSVSSPAAKFAKKRFKVKSEVVPNAVAVSHFHTGRPIRKYDDGKVNIVYLGRLVERKGCLYLLQAIERLHKKNMLFNVRVIIAGKGPQENMLKQFVKEKGLGKIVIFLGFISEDDKPNLLASADIAVMPSTGGESFGIVLVEAMAAGADVVIAGNNKGYRTVMNGHKEQLIKPSDINAFEKMLKHFIINRRARARAKKWQTARALEYDVRIIGTKLLEVYTSALRSKKTRGR